MQACRAEIVGGHVLEHARSREDAVGANPAVLEADALTAALSREEGRAETGPDGEMLGSGGGGSGASGEGRAGGVGAVGGLGQEPATPGSSGNERDDDLPMPWAWKIRSHPALLTAVVTIGVMSDLLAYTIIVPVLPYRLESMGYSNISSLTSWLLFAYSAGIFVGTFPVAFYFHRYPYRRGPLIGGVLAMEASFLLFMLPRPYWCMVLARVLQGISSCIVWTVGLALICENIDPSRLGMNLGFAFSGMSIGITIAPPIGGALYKHLGWHAPFIFCIIVLGVDGIGRLFILDRRDLARHRCKMVRKRRERERAGTGAAVTEDGEKTSACPDDAAGVATAAALPSAASLTPTLTHQTDSGTSTTKEKELSPFGVLLALMSIPRGMVALLLVFVFGFIVGALDATLTIRVENVWHKDSDYVGLIYLAAAAPAFFIGPVAGWLADKYGGEVVLLPALVFCLPWMPLLTLKSSIAGFIVYFALCNLVATLLNSVASLELAIVSKFKPGISEIHEFAAMNLAFATSSAIGAIVGGQIYDHVHNGWDVVCWIGFALFAIMVGPPLIWTGNWPIIFRILKRPGPKSGMAPEDRAEMERKQREDADSAERAEPTEAEAVAPPSP